MLWLKHGDKVLLKGHVAIVNEMPGYPALKDLFGAWIINPESNERLNLNHCENLGSDSYTGLEMFDWPRTVRRARGDDV